MMFYLIKIILFLISSQSWALTVMQVGSKHSLNKSHAYHFSSKKLISVHSIRKSPFIIGLKIGDLTFKENSTEKRILILNKEQLQFFNKTNFIVESSPFLKWQIRSEKLEIAGNSSENEFRSLLKTCSFLKLKTVVIQTPLTPSRHERSTSEYRCLGLIESYSIEVALLNENTLSGHSTGLGIPSELAWSINPKLQFNNIQGSIKAGGQKSSAHGHSFFTALLEENEPLVFESGSEILIKPSGVFNRQKNEWKKAVSNIEIKILNSTTSFIKTLLKINTTQRTGESQIYNIEKFEQTKTLKLNEWEKIFVFKQSGKTRNNGGLFNTGVLGHSSKSENYTNKQLWVKVKYSD